MDNKQFTCDFSKLSSVTIDATTNKVVDDPTSIVNMEDANSKPKRGRPKKEQKESAPSNRRVPTPLNSDMSYIETYSQPIGLLRESIGQLTTMEQRVLEDINTIRASKTLKSKYVYLANLTGAYTGLVSTKISAARELKSIYSDANNFELKKQQQLKIDERDSDDKIISDMYTKMLNTPVGTVSNGAINMSIPSSYINSNVGTPIITAANGQNYADNSSEDTGFKNYMNNLTPEQNSMMQETNPYIETVLVYNQSDQNKWFEVIDTRTGQPVPNMPIPNDFVKDGCNVDIRHGIARNASLNQTYKLKLVGVRGDDEF